MGLEQLYSVEKALPAWGTEEALRLNSRVGWLLRLVSCLLSKTSELT